MHLVDHARVDRVDRLGHPLPQRGSRVHFAVLEAQVQAIEIADGEHGGRRRPLGDTAKNLHC